MSGKKILFVYSNFSSFVAHDHGILASVYEVRQYRFRAIKGLLGMGIELVKQFVFLFVSIWKADAVYVWFADYHSLLPVLFARIWRKESFIVVGGYDVSYLPEYNYGSFNRPVRKFFAKSSLRLATICFPVAEALGAKIRLISPSAKVEVLPTTTDFNQFNLLDYEREKIVLTVATTSNHQRAMIKGLDRFRELAAAMPDFEFVIIGVSQSFRSFFEPIPDNLKLIPQVSYNELPDYYNKASYYAQFSRSEGLPNSLCEAMLCGCIPLGTDVGDIKLTIEGIGLVINEWNLAGIPEFIRNNQTFNLLRKVSRERIIKMYDPEIRKRRLIRLC
jgi:glycosyltransferase involved in cell wall biosynthesis